MGLSKSVALIASEYYLTRFAIPMTALSALGGEGIPRKMATGILSPLQIPAYAAYHWANDTGFRAVTSGVTSWFKESSYNLLDNVVNRPYETAIAAGLTLATAEGVALVLRKIRTGSFF